MNSLLELGLVNALTALAIAPLAAWVGWRGRRPALAHGLWLLVLLKLVCPPLYTWSVPWPTLSKTVTSAPAPLTPPLVDSTTEVATETEREAEVGEEVVVYELVAVEAEVTNEALALKPRVEASQAAIATESRFLSWRLVLAGFWVLGTAAWTVVTLGRVRRFRRLLEEARPADSELQATTDALARRLGLAKGPLVGLLPGSLSPFVWSLGGPPRLLLPTSLWDALDDEQRGTLLTHELAHLKRRDHWVRGLELLATALFWWHPVVYWARRGLREAEEQCCDAWVVWAWPKAAKAYATALLETVDFLAEAPASLPVAASGLGHVEQLKRRLTMILSGLTPHRLTFAGRIALIGLAAALLPLAPSIARSPQQDAKPAQSPNKPDSDPINLFVTVTDDKDDKDDDDDKDEAKAKKKAEASAKADARKKESAESADSRVRGEKKGDDKDDDDDKAKSNADAARKQADEARMRAAEVRKKVEEMRVRALASRRPGQPQVAKEKAEAAKAYTEARRAQMEHQDQFRVVQKQLEKAQADMLKAQGDLARATKQMAELGMKVSGAGESGNLRTRVVTVSPDGRPVEIDSDQVILYQTAPLQGDGGQARVEVRTESTPSPDGKPGPTHVYTRILRNAEALTSPGVRVQGRIMVPAVPPVPPVPPTPPIPPHRAIGSFLPAPSADVRSQDARIDAMERQLKQLLDEMKELRKGDSKGQGEGASRR